MNNSIGYIELQLSQAPLLNQNVMNKKTHEVLDLHYTPDEGQGCFDGTLEECIEFAATQTPCFMYKVVPMTKEEIERHPDNNPNYCRFCHQTYADQREYMMHNTTGKCSRKFE